MKIKRLFIFVAIFLAAVVSSQAQNAADQTKDLDSLYAQKLLKPGTVAPDFILPMMNNYKVQLSEFKGKYVLLDFWATWCPDCRKDIPAVKELYDKYGSKVEFIGVSFDCRQRDEMAAGQRTEEDARCRNLQGIRSGVDSVDDAHRSRRQGGALHCSAGENGKGTRRHSEIIPHPFSASP